MRACDTCWRLRLAWTAAASFSSCFTLILTTSCKSFSLDSLESKLAYSICLMVSISGQTVPGSQEGLSWAWVMVWGVRVWHTLVQAEGGEATEGVGTGPEEEGNNDGGELLLWQRYKH